ncbi:MAG: hypothetical protein Q8Q60_05280 [Candidatus Chromulinivorax sp.]|nr:hypothetical protein [Candidatus Chromulinivorax sp.]
MKRNKFLVLMVVGLFFGATIESSNKENEGDYLVRFLQNYQSHFTNEEMSAISQLIPFASAKNESDRMVASEANVLIFDIIKAVESRSRLSADASHKNHIARLAAIPESTSALTQRNKTKIKKQSLVHRT